MKVTIRGGLDVIFNPPPDSSLAFHAPVHHTTPLTREVDDESGSSTDYTLHFNDLGQLVFGKRTRSALGLGRLFEFAHWEASQAFGKTSDSSPVDCPDVLPCTLRSLVVGTWAPLEACVFGRFSVVLIPQRLLYSYSS